MAFTPNPAGQSLVKTLSVYDTTELIRVVENLKTPTSFLSDKFFSNATESWSEKVAIDIDYGKRRMTPFVSELVEGRPVESRQYGTTEFRPPYQKDFRVPDLMKPVRRQIGEAIGGQIGNHMRLQENLIWELRDQLENVQRRLEWMAAQALLTGRLEARGEGYSTPLLLDYNRDPALTVALTGKAAWGQPGVSPSASIIAMAQTVLQKSGAFPTEIIFSTDAFNAFIKDPQVQMQIAQRAILMASDSGSVEARQAIETGGRVEKGGVYMGCWGQFNLYVYNEWFVEVDEHGIEVEKPMIPDGTVLMTSGAMEGVRAIAPIKDPYFNYAPMMFAPKMWFKKNPATINMMMQSCTLMIPSRVNAAAAMTVLDPANANTPAQPSGTSSVPDTSGSGTSGSSDPSSKKAA